MTTPIARACQAAAALVWSVQPAAPVRWADVLAQPAPWYASAEARAAATVVRGYQRPDGGWPKNIDMTVPPAAESATSALESTLDNGATVTQIVFLARVFQAAGDPRDRDAALAGLDYVLAAQYPNGGWPQVYPLRQDYSRHITFNDNAMIGAASLAEEAAAGREPFAFVDAGRRTRARSAVAKAVDVVLRAQVRVGGGLTAWCAQHDAVTLEPRGARTYEHPSLSGQESVGIVRFLMRHAGDRSDVAAAVEAAVAWLRRVPLRGVRLDQRPDPSAPRGWDRVLVRDPSAPPLWARFYEIGTDRPIFSGRDGVIRYQLAEIEYERRTGYAWVGDWPRTLLETEYPAWRARRAAPGLPSPGAAFDLSIIG